MVHAELTVAAVVERNARFLVVEEIAGGTRVLNQPAGHVEPGESILEAVIREAREETAWGFTPTGLVGMYYWPHVDGRTTLRFAFCGQVDDHAVDQALDEDIITTHWMTAAELARRNDLRSPLVLRAIEDYADHPPLPLERVRHIRSAP
ncbi:NUDIX hydrolase [Salinisphaera sp. T31B1]